MKKILSLFLLTACYLSLATNVFSQYGQPPSSLSILIDKYVGKSNTSITDPVNADYVDNLSPSDSRFRAGQSIFFKIIVKNTSKTNLYNVTVKDFLPSYIEPASGPGTYDGSARTIIFNVGDFAPNEEKVYYFKMQIDSIQYLPVDKGLFCIVNKAQAYNDNVFDDDTAQFCVEKEVVGVPKVPSAGPEYGLILIGFNILSLSAGIIMKRRIK